MMQASVEAADLDKRIAAAQKKDSLGSLLKYWQDASWNVESAFQRAKTGLAKEGSPLDQLQRISKRLMELRAKSEHFNLQSDLDACVDHWTVMGQEFAQLS